MPSQRLQFPYLIGYFQPISLDSLQSSTIQSYGLLTWTTIVRSNPNKLLLFVKGPKVGVGIGYLTEKIGASTLVVMFWKCTINVNPYASCG